MKYFNAPETHDAGNLLALFLAHVLELAKLIACLASILNHLCHQVISIYHGSLAALHLTVRQLYHTVREVEPSPLPQF